MSMKPDKSERWASNDVIGTLVNAAAIVVGGCAVVVWMMSVNDNVYAKEIRDIDPTPHLSFVVAMLGLAVFVLERIRRELARLRFLLPPPTAESIAEDE